jgi:hypothetical protein
MIDPNQSSKECFSGNQIKPFFIEWLHLQRGLEDPFITLAGCRPNSMTTTANRDIDFILTYGIQVQNITTLYPNCPSHSDHLGIVFDIDLASYFSARYSDIAPTPSRQLSSGNFWSVNKYLEYVKDQIVNHKLAEKVDELVSLATDKNYVFTSHDASLLKEIDQQLTDIMLHGESLCDKKKTSHQPWSPEQRTIARTFSYWK